MQDAREGQRYYYRLYQRGDLRKEAEFDLAAHCLFASDHGCVPTLRGRTPP